MSTGSNDVYIVKNQTKDDSTEILIPAIESVVLEIDFENKTMRVDLPEGLWILNAVLRYSYPHPHTDNRQYTRDEFHSPYDFPGNV